MKTLKLSHEAAVAQLAAKKGSTWRLFDEKQLAVNDVITLIDKREEAPESWAQIGTAVVDQVIEKRLADVTEADLRLSGVYDSRDTMFAELRGYYGADVSWKTPVKIIFYSLQANGDARPVAPAPEEVKLYTDGGSRGNPGPSAAGYVMYDMDQNQLHKEGVYLGVTTNNQAEYLGLKLGLEACHAAGARTVHVYMDSLLVVNQMNRAFKVKNRDLWPIHEAVRELISQFDKVSFAHVPRALNKEADEMVNKALDNEV